MENNLYFIRDVPNITKKNIFDDQTELINFFSEMYSVQLIELNFSPSGNVDMLNETLNMNKYFSFFDTFLEIPTDYFNVLNFNDFSIKNDDMVIREADEIFVFDNKMRIKFKIIRDKNMKFLNQLERYDEEGSLYQILLFSDRGIPGIRILNPQTKNEIFEFLNFRQEVKLRILASNYSKTDLMYGTNVLLEEKKQWINDFVIQKDENAPVIAPLNPNIGEVLSEINNPLFIFMNYENIINNEVNDHILKYINSARKYIFDSVDTENVFMSKFGELVDKKQHIIHYPVPNNIVPAEFMKQSINYIGVKIDKKINIYQLVSDIDRYLGMLGKNEPIIFSLYTTNEKDFINTKENLDNMLKQFNNEEMVNHIETVYLKNKKEYIDFFQRLKINIDFGEDIDFTMQLTSLSNGTPQINSHKSKYVIEGSNGLVIKKQVDLFKQIDYFLYNLFNLNNSIYQSLSMNFNQLELF